MSEEDTRERPPSNPEPLFRPRSSKTPGMSKAKKRRRSDSALTPKEAFASSLDEEEEGGRPVPNSNSISALQGAVMAFFLSLPSIPPLLWMGGFAPASHAPLVLLLLAGSVSAARGLLRTSPARMCSSDLEHRKNPQLYATAGRAAPAAKRKPRSKPEVLAPAGGWAQARAAVASGADAIYFGVRESFNARARAENFGIDELPELMGFLHSHGVKGFCTVNVLLFDEELHEAESLVRALAAAGIDALIVQDPAVLMLARRIAEWLPLHASTQMSITSAEGAEFVTDGFGCSRVVVGRELSVREISRVAERTDAEVEAFVHGALCVSYSGQCLSSESWGGRSANRGQCAQACRLPYGLLVNGSLAELGDVQYLLSPQDLMAIDLVPELIDAGVACFKIEGRLKGPEYVALTTRAYRAAVDAAWEATERREDESSPDATAPFESDPARAPSGRLSSEEREALVAPLRQVFARGQDAKHDGLTPGFLEGVRHQRLVRGRAPGHRGVLVGEVTDVRPTKSEVVVRVSAGLKRGDGVVFDGGRRGMREDKEEGGPVFALRDALSGEEIEPRDEARSAGRTVVMSFRRGALDLSRVHAGDIVWRTKDHALEAATRSMLRRQFGGAGASAQTSAQGAPPLEELPAAHALASDGVPPLGSSRVRAVASGSLGSPLQLRLTDADGVSVVAQSDVPLEVAQRAPLTSAALRKAIGTLRDSELVLEGVEERFGTPSDESENPGQRLGSSLDELSAIAAGLFLPAGEVKATRRRAAVALLEARKTAAAEAKAQREHAIEEGDALSALLREYGCMERRARRRRPRGGSTVAEGGRNAEWRGEEPLPAKLSVLCRSAEQAAAAAESGLVDEVGLDFLEVHGPYIVAGRPADRRHFTANGRGNTGAIGRP